MNPVQQIIATKLKELAKELEQFEQTTHGKIGQWCSIERVASALVAAHNEPSAYNISDLSQLIEMYLRAADAGATNDFHKKLPRYIMLPPGAPPGTLEAARNLLENTQ